MRHLVRTSAKTVADLHVKCMLQKNMLVCSAFVPSPAPHGGGSGGTKAVKKAAGANRHISVVASIGREPDS
jgi:hypothetical protein